MDKFLNQLSGKEFLDRDHKAITLLGMSGIGKTTLCNNLPSNNWFKYSGDYRIGTRYLDEAILDNIKKHAMKVPSLADLLRTDSIYICHNITINNLYPVSSFLGKVGDPSKNGLNLEEFLRRQQLHHSAEIKAMQDVPYFIEKARNIYGYQHFVNDAGGSLSELDDLTVFPMLARCTLIVYLEASEDMVNTLIERAISNPKPVYYKSDFFQQKINEYCEINNLSNHSKVEPDDFISWVFPQLINDRIPRYRNIAKQYGITINANFIDQITGENDLITMVAEALNCKNKTI